MGDALNIGQQALGQLASSDSVQKLKDASKIALKDFTNSATKGITEIVDKKLA
jgi:hypothetical protein